MRCVFRRLRARLARHHDQGVVTLGQPGRGGLLQAFRRGRGQHFETVAKAAGIAHEYRTFGQRVGLATKAADALDAADKAGLEHGAGALQFPGTDAVGDQALYFLIEYGFDLLDIFRLGRVDNNGKRRAQLAAPRPCADAVGQFGLVYQTLVQTRGATATEHVRHQAQAFQVGIAELGHIPNPINAGLGHAIAHGFARGGFARSRIGRNFRHRDTGWNIAEITQCLFFCRRHIDVAGQHQHGIVGAIPRAEPVLHIVQRSGVQVRHRADHRAMIRVIFRVTGTRQRIPDQAVRLVFALPLFVLDHAALLVEQGLINRTEKMPHAV